MSDMEHAIEQAAQVMARAYFGEPVEHDMVCAIEWARALADAGLLAPTPLREEVWPLVSGSDPALYVIRESDLPTVQQDEDGEWYPGDRWDLADDRFIDVEGALEKMHLYAAIARAIEAEQSVDPVEAKAAEFYDLAGRVGDDIWAACRNIAAYVLGQEIKK